MAAYRKVLAMRAPNMLIGSISLAGGAVAEPTSSIDLNQSFLGSLPNPEEGVARSLQPADVTIGSVHGGASSTLQRRSRRACAARWHMHSGRRPLLGYDV